MGLFKKKKRTERRAEEQNLEEKAEFQSLYQICNYCLKKTSGQAGGRDPTPHTALEETFGTIDIVSIPNHRLGLFAVKISGTV